MEKDLDKKLYNDYLNGEKKAFEYLYKKYKNKIEYFIYNIVKDYQKAEDLTQETFMYVMQNNIQENGSFKYCIYLVAKSKTYNYINVEKRRNEISEQYILNESENTDKDVLEIITKEETRKELLTSIEKLDDKYKNAVYLTNIEGLSYEETSIILGQTLQNTKTLIHRGKKQLKKILLKKGVCEMNKISKVIAILIVTTVVFSGLVYAVTGGTIDGIPVLDWLGIKFSDKYIEYKQPVENQIIAFDDTTIELVSTLCNEGLTILEFNLKLSEEEYKKLKIDENIVTDDYLKQIDENKETERERITSELRDELINKELQNGNFNIENLVISEDEINSRYEKRLEEIEKNLDERKNTKFIPAISLNYNQIGGTSNYDIYNQNMEWYASIYIDDTPYYVGNFEKIEKVSNYEYRIYVVYLISDDILEGKNNFKISLKNNKLVSIVNWENIAWRNDCQRFARELDVDMNIPTTDIIDLPSEIEVEVSKNDILKDSVILDNLKIVSEFRNITQTVEKVVISPIQTVVKINHSASKQSSNSFENIYPDNPNIEYLPVTREYKVYDANGRKLICFAASNKNTLIYSDGTREEYDSHDVPNKKYSNATWETIEYLLIENTDTDYIKIVPVEIIRNPIDSEIEESGEIYYEMEPLIIDLK